MEFNEPKSIYVQIADQICARILQEEWLSGERIPSIRELAVEQGVNPNTITKSYQLLLDKGVILNQRGRGYFVCDNASQIIQQEMKNKFIQDDIPEIIKTMQLLNISIEELTSFLHNKIKPNKNPTKK